MRNTVYADQTARKCHGCGLGRHTHKAPGVLAEVSMAKEAGVPIIQLLAKRSSGYQRIPGAGPVRAWSHDNLERIFDKR
jgi:hypothetical protein